MTSPARLPTDLAHAVADPKAYGDMDTLHQSFARIRRDSAGWASARARYPAISTGL